MKTKVIVLILFFFCLFFSFPTSLYAQKKPFIVVLDAGHGGKDPGNRGNGYFEKDIALKIALEAGKILEKNKNFKVVYTRKTDIFIGLSERANIANKADADLFVSIHCNAHNSNAYGTETFVLGLHKSEENFEVAKKENQVIFLEENYQETYAGFDPTSPESLIGLTLLQEDYLDQSIEVASYIQNNFTTQLKRNDRSVKQAGFWVLLKTSMPSVLIEVGFLTNKNEGAYLNSSKGQGEMAQAIANAITKYYQSLSSYSSSSSNSYGFVEPETTNTHVEDSKNEEVTEKPEIYKGVQFKVQIAAGSKKLETNASNFNGLKGVTREKEGNLYRYFFGETSDYMKIKDMHTQAKSKGFPSAFIVAYKNGKRVNVTEVIKD